MKVEILGPGCNRCAATKENVRKALESLRLQAEVVHISDPLEFARGSAQSSRGITKFLGGLL
jgi:hypothetical protein